MAVAVGADAIVAAFAPATLGSLGIRNGLEQVATAGTVTAAASVVIAVTVATYAVALALVRVAAA